MTCHDHTILVVADAFWPQQTGGVTKSLVTEVEELVDNGHEVVVVTRQLLRDSPRHESRTGYHLYRYPSPSKESYLYHTYPLASMMFLPKLINRLHGEYNFDLAYVHNVFQSVGIRRAASEIPQVYNYHAPLSEEIEIHAQKGKYGWKTPVVRAANYGFKRLERSVVENADTLLLRSQFMHDKLVQHHGHYDAEILPLAVDTDRFCFVEDPSGNREELGLPPDRPILLSVRRLVPRVGLELLISAMKTVIKQHPDVLLLIAGKGYLRDTLEQQIQELGLEENIRFLGFVPEEDLPTYYGAADLSIMPTEKLEGFGLSTIESLSCGTPVVATPVGANPEVLNPLNEELVASEASADSLALQLNEWIEQGVSSSYRTACREYCEEKFSAETVVRNLEDLFDQI